MTKPKIIANRLDPALLRQFAADNGRNDLTLRLWGVDWLVRVVSTGAWQPTSTVTATPAKLGPQQPPVLTDTLEYHCTRITDELPSQDFKRGMCGEAAWIIVEYDEGLDSAHFEWHWQNELKLGRQQIFAHIAGFNFSVQQGDSGFYLEPTE